MGLLLRGRDNDGLVVNMVMYHEMPPLRATGLQSANARQSVTSRERLHRQLSSLLVFKRDFKTKGHLQTSTYLRTFKIGDRKSPILSGKKAAKLTMPANSRGHQSELCSTERHAP